MKTFKQFSEQAYESYELIEGPIDYLRSKIKSKVQSVKDYPSTLRSAVSAIKKDPIGSLKAGSKGLTKVVAKDVITSPIATRIKRATGNNPIANLAIDTAADVASVTPWKQTAKQVATQTPKLARTFGKNLLVRGPQTALRVGQGLLTLTGVGSRLK